MEGAGGKAGKCLRGGAESRLLSPSRSSDLVFGDQHPARAHSGQSNIWMRGSGWRSLLLTLTRDLQRDNARTQGTR